jgi:hypothetical protein
MTDEKMTSAERRDLAALIRRREKVAKTATNEVKARRLADLEVQLASVFAAEDEHFAEQERFMEHQIALANQAGQRHAEEMGIPERFRPYGQVLWHGRGENATAERRAELRRVGQTQADADQKQALTRIEAASVEAQTALLRDGLTTNAARQWLDSLPTAEQLLPALEVSSLLKALPGHHNDEPLSERYSRWDRHDWRLDRAALNELLGAQVGPEEEAALRSAVTGHQDNVDVDDDDDDDDDAPERDAS